MALPGFPKARKVPFSKRGPLIKRLENSNKSHARRRRLGSPIADRLHVHMRDACGLTVWFGSLSVVVQCRLRHLLHDWHVRSSRQEARQTQDGVSGSEDAPPLHSDSDSTKYDDRSVTVNSTIADHLQLHCQDASGPVVLVRLFISGLASAEGETIYMMACQIHSSWGQAYSRR